MKEGNTKILTLLVILVVIGLAFAFFTKTEQEDQVKTEKSNNESQKNDPLVKEREQEVFSAQLENLEEVIVELDQNDLKKFKEQTGKGLNTIANLINELPNVQEKNPNNVTKETKKIQRHAERVVLVDGEEKTVEQIKEGFDSAKNSVQLVTKDIEQSEQKEDLNEKFQTNVEKRTDKIDEMIEKVDEKNYKERSKDLFIEFHSLLSYMNNQMSKQEVLTSTSQKNNIDRLNEKYQYQEEKKEKESQKTEETKE